jgi:hypothetical protein
MDFHTTYRIVEHIKPLSKYPYEILTNKEGGRVNLFLVLIYVIKFYSMETYGREFHQS